MVGFEPSVHSYEGVQMRAGRRFSILSAVFWFEVEMDVWVLVCGCGAPAEI